MKIYAKKLISFEEQVELLIERGLIVSDKNRVIKNLKEISYYRFSAYMLPFKPYKNLPDTDLYEQFADGTTWQDIHDLYLFDRKLRLLVFDQIERIEIRIRTKVCYNLAMKYGSHWQDNKSIFKDREYLDKKTNLLIIDSIYKELQNHIKKDLSSNASETFIKHYRDTYCEPTNPPSWMCVEIMYFNQLSKIFQNLKNRNDRTEISKCYDLPENIFSSWLHTINYVRNVCAHHSRLWNRDYHIVPMKLSFSKNLNWISNPDTVQRSKTYFFLCILNYLLQVVNPTSSFKNKLKELFIEFPKVNLGFMGFPNLWESENFWK